ncbi:MAG TPA: hypothetical protein VJ953_20105 [Saprospiraceae bacterium]|nr:hypothetical protein [Saprospiraceae bacterium]
MKSIWLQQKIFMKDVERFRKEIGTYTGSSQFFHHPLFSNFLYTEGVKFMADTLEAYWLIEHIMALQLEAPLQHHRFQVWKIQVREDTSATITATNRAGRVIKTIEFELTDFPLESFTLWWSQNLLLLPRED